MLTATTGLAHAQTQEPTAEARSAAAAAYQQGVRSFEAGEFSAAAEFFETADRTAPAAAAAIYAIRAHRGARTPAHDARAATIGLQLLSRYPTDTRVTSYSYRIVDELSPGLARVQVRCQGCDLSLDDQESAHEVFTSPGHHTLVAAWGTRTLRREVDAPAGQTTRLELAPPLTSLVPSQPVPNPVPPVGSNPSPMPAPTPAPAPRQEPAVSVGEQPPVYVDPPRPSGASPAVFVTGLILTAGLGGALAWSALNTLEGRDAYVQNPTQEGLDDGRERELRTNLLIGATAGVGLATIIVGACCTRWRSARRYAVAPTVLPDAQASASPALLFRGQF